MTFKFNPGLCVVTGEIHEELPLEVCALSLSRHVTGDYGEVCDEDKRMNYLAVENKQGRILSQYSHHTKGKFWIITDGLGTEDLHTTILFPHEY